jgi:N-acetyl-gamma-glutamyl-phosphate reductase common form
VSGQRPEAAAIPAVVLGGSGYVAGELLRLLAGHPAIRPVAAFSESQAGEPVEAAFPHLAGCYRGLAFSGRGDLARKLAELADGAAEAPAVAAFSAAPHGSAAPLVDELMAAAESAGVALRVVDLSADFRFASAADYARVYGKPHGAPERVAAFRCALPEHRADDPGACVGHPGCFTTATLLAAVPLLALALVEPRLSVVAVTGSTGAGRAPSATTHHPARRSNLFAYSPLAHRHEPEMRALAEAASGVAAEIHFVPQAGPFARGIYATLQARMARPLAAADVREALLGFYAGAPFVHVAEAPPRLQDVVGSNRCLLAVAVDGDHLAVFSAIDNLVKGAAGGAIQWMNRLLGLPETAGLTPAGLGWL